MTAEKFTIRNMTEDEVRHIAVNWASKEGWNPGIYDASCFYQADPNGFYIGLLGNEPAACISLVEYDQNFSFLGFYIVKPEFRGNGFGHKIWKTALENVKSQNIGLDGVIAQQENYVKSGFKFAYRNIRFEGISRCEKIRFENIVEISKVSFEDIANYDSNIFPTARRKFLECWIKQPESLALAALVKGKVAGYSVIRKCEVGFKIGPLFADDKVLAEQLFLTSINFTPPGSKFYLDTPEVYAYAVKLAESQNMQKVFETARMYTRSQPDKDLAKVFGVTSFELG